MPFFFFIVSVLISKGQWIMSRLSVLVIIMCSNAHFYLQVADLLKSSSIKFIMIFLLITPPTSKSKDLQLNVLINAIRFRGQICQQSGSFSKAGDPFSE